MARKRYVFGLLGSMFVVLLASTASHLSYGAEHPLGFLHELAAQAPSWLTWGLVTPTLLRVGSRHRLRWPPAPAAIVMHVAAWGLSSSAFALVRVASSSLGGLPDYAGLSDEPFVTLVRATWIGWLPTSAIIYVAILVAGYAAESGQRAQRQQTSIAALEVELAHAQLDALRMQINPHFLFNTLNTVAVFAREGDGRGAAELVGRLSHIMRRLLRGSTQHEAPLFEELSFLRDYLDIEQARFGERLQVAWEITDEARAALVPQLILQPLVENALRHGLSPRAATGRLTIAAARVQDWLEVIVRDDGAGLGTGWAEKRGVGLNNVHARLVQMYGAGSALRIGPAPDRGTLAVIRLPFHHARGR